LTYVLFTIGLVALFFGGEFLVRGAVGIARVFRVPPLVIGLTIVGFGTSMPEMLVSVQAALKGTPAIAIGNVVGSNIANILLILGISALIAPVMVHVRSMARDFAVMIGATALIWLLMLDGMLSRGEGIGLVAALLVYLAWCLRDKAEPEPEGTVPPVFWMSVILAIGGLAALMLGARLLVDSATEIARAFGVSEAVIGLTIVAVGTSLPEMATSVVAAFRKQADIAIGNIIGSNTFNILGILGITALVAPVPVDPRFVGVDMTVAMGAALALLALGMAFGGVGRLSGAVLLGGYLGYVVLTGLF
jgi:cation:H+ antiporter